MSTAPRNAAAKRDWGHDETGCTVLHIDMDAFYASLEIARKPQLRGHPVIIGWEGPRSVVSAANYEARRYGVNSAMPMARAKQLCPGGAYVNVDMPYYREMSKKIFDNVFRQVTDQIEQVSVDEGYMDVSSALLRWKSPSTIGAWIRAQVTTQFGITCSVGIAANKLVAKMASTNAKPDGMLLIPKARHAEFVQMMPLRGIPGIGPSLEKRLNEWGVKTVADLAKMDEPALLLATHSKITAHNLFLAARGQDERPIVTHAPEKSIGAEITFEQDTRNFEEVRELLHHCSNEVTHALRQKRLVARTVTVKLRFADLSYSTKSHTLERPIDTAATMYPESVALLKAMLKMPADAGDDTPLPREIRLTGVSASSLSAKGSTPVQLTIDDLLDGDSGAGNRSGQSNSGNGPAAGDGTITNDGPAANDSPAAGSGPVANNGHALVNNPTAVNSSVAGDGPITNNGPAANDSPAAGDGPVAVNSPAANHSSDSDNVNADGSNQSDGGGKRNNAGNIANARNTHNAGNTGNARNTHNVCNTGNAEHNNHNEANESLKKIHDTSAHTTIGRQDGNPQPTGNAQTHSDVEPSENRKERAERIRTAETVLDAVRERYGTGAATLGLDHTDWKAKQIANNSKPES